MRLPRLLDVLLLATSLVACQANPRKLPDSAATVFSGVEILVGDFDSHAQSLAAASSRWQISVSDLPQKDWLLWSARVESSRPLRLTLPFHVQQLADGGVKLVPHVSVQGVAALGQEFDSRQWRPLEACALSGKLSASRMVLAADRATCATVVQTLGETAALLPLSVQPSRNGLLVRSYADQGEDSRQLIAATRVSWFDGWAAVLGAGAQAAAGSDDWHMNRKLHIGSEGGHVAVNWRDGQPSGYELRLERIAVQEGTVPLLKLSILDRDGNVLAYAWSEAEAQRIGINLGWIQIGLERAAVSSVRH